MPKQNQVQHYKAEIIDGKAVVNQDAIVQNAVVNQDAPVQKTHVEVVVQDIQDNNVQVVIDPVTEMLHIDIVQ